MSMLKTISVRLYLWSIYRELPGSHKQRKQILSKMENSVQNYASESSELSYKELITRFGTPKQIAECYIAEMDVSELRNTLKTGNRVLNLLVVVATLALFIWLGFVALAYYDVFKYENGYSTIEIEEIEQTQDTEGGIIK